MKQKEVDVEKLAEKYADDYIKKTSIHPFTLEGITIQDIVSIMNGYNQALQSSDKMFSLEDMKEAYLNNGPPDENGFYDFIQSLTKEK